MKYGYLPNNLTSVGECEVYMLPGLSAEFDACRIAGLTISRIDFHEFRIIEKSQFADDLQDVFAYNRVPFYCIFSSYNLDEELARLRSPLRAQAVLRLTRALWLLKEGRLYNPLDFITYKRTGSMNERDTKSFGRLGYSAGRGYELSREEVPVLEGIFYALATFDEARVSQAIDMAENLFMATYNPALIGATDPFLLLLGSLEALAGDRVERLMKASWITSDQRKLLQQFRKYRNGIAHGKLAAEYKQVTALREIVRCLLREALVRILQEPTAADAVGEELVDRLVKLDDVGPLRLANVETEYSRWGPQE
jgi:hypothetical protein